MPKTIAILGAGWLGEPLADLLQAAGYAINAATTRPAKAKRLRKKGLETYLVHLDHSSDQLPAAFFRAEVLVLTVPPGGRRDPEVERTYPAKIERAVAAAQAGGISKVLFTSSTGVYGAAPGWVTEESVLQPTTASGKALVKVEHQLRANYGNHLTVLRLAGLVGGERHPGRWFAGKQSVPGGEQYVNLVHRKDVLNIAERILSDDHWGHTLNVCADEHPTKAELYPIATRALGLEVPDFAIDKNAAPGKRVDNRRAKAILNYEYEFGNPLSGKSSYF